MIPLLDARGGTCVLRGTNIATEAKWRKDRQPLIDDTLFEFVRDVGMNAVRLPVFWDAIEPEEGHYDEGYLAWINDVVARARGANLEVMVDMHQDLFGRAFGAAGAPAWLVPPQDRRKRCKRLFPTLWFLDYLRAPVRRAFDRLYDEHADRLANVWKMLARSLRAHDVRVFDLLNEPSFGSRAPFAFEREVLPSFYERLIDAIREVNTQTWIAIEPTTTASVGLATRLQPPDRARLVYAPHCYPAAVEVGASYSDLTKPTLARIASRIAQDGERLKLPVMVGEFGARGASGRFLADALDEFDAHRLSAFHWDVGSGAYGLRSSSNRALGITRPNVRRVGGALRSVRANYRELVMEWDDPGDVGETRVSLPAGRWRSSQGVVGDRELIIDGQRAARRVRVERAGRIER